MELQDTIILGSVMVVLLLVNNIPVMESFVIAILANVILYVVDSERNREV